MVLGESEHSQLTPTSALKRIGRDVIVGFTALTIGVLLKELGQMDDQGFLAGIQDIQHIIHPIQLDVVETCITRLFVCAGENAARLTASMEKQIENRFDHLLCITLS